MPNNLEGITCPPPNGQDNPAFQCIARYITAESCQNAGEPGQNSLLTSWRKPPECWVPVMMWEKWSWQEVYRTKHTRSHKELITSYSMFYFTSPLMWSTPHPLSLTTTEWAWRASFRRTSGRFRASHPTPHSVVCCGWGESNFNSLQPLPNVSFLL